MSSLGNFVWGIADQLRGVYKPHQYGNVILPMTILRRLDCVMEPHRDVMRTLAASTSNPQLLATKVRNATGLTFHNTSQYDFPRLVAEPDQVKVNLANYLGGFSENIDVFDRFKVAAEIATLAEKNRLLLVVQQFARVDLHPDVVPNAEMGDLFEELIRRFAEASNETAGEHFTPRDAIRLMVDLLFAEDADLHRPGLVRSVYDPTAGTGGMLSVAEEHLKEMNPDASLVMYGQEINDQSYAICKSDLIAKGQDAGNVGLEDTLANDLFAGKTFDFCLSNPPYGVDWKASQDSVIAERKKMGPHSRFGPGLPRVGDGQMLFLTHLAHKMRPPHEKGGRAAIVLNGSPLFTGGAESGESEIRRWLLENDLVEAIVALPTNMFYNTGISTYVWLLDNAKSGDRVGRVQLIDGSSFFTKMRKNLGQKSREISQADRERILRIRQHFDAQPTEDAEHSRIFETTDFGYWAVTVERPLRLSFSCTPERVEALLASAAGRGPLKSVDTTKLRTALLAVGEQTYHSRPDFLAALKPNLVAAGLGLGATHLKPIWQGIGERDASAEICTDAKGNPEPDVSLRDTENVPFGWAPLGDDGNSRHGERHRDFVITAYMAHEVTPHVPDAWIDWSKTKVGYEVPFTRHFYKYVLPRPLEEIDAELGVLVKEIIDLLQDL